MKFKDKVKSKVAELRAKAPVVATTGALVVGTSMTALAEDATTTTSMANVTSAVDVILNVAGSVINFGLENPVLAIVLVGGTVIPTGMAVFHGFRH